MTHSYADSEPDPMKRRVKQQIARLDHVIGQLEARQVQLPHIADTLQDKIDKLKTHRDSYENKLRECMCGHIRADHVNEKCPFASTTFVYKWDIRNY